MKAAFIQETGPASNIRFGELPSPTPSSTQIVVKTQAVSVNPIDTYIRSGMIPMPIPLPFIVGCDFAGVVDSVGDAATRFKVGDRVWGSNQGLLGRQGTFAERIAVEECFAYPTPDNVDDKSIASVALVAITAHLGLAQRANLRAGQTLFVSGGAGGVGSMVCQMGKALGARVITSAGSDERVDICRKLGVDEAFNHNSSDRQETIKALAPDGIDLFWETRRQPDFEGSIDVLAENGTMVVMAGRDAKPAFPVGPFYVKGCSLVGFAMFKASPETQQQSAQAINNWLSQGHLKANIGKEFPLAEAAAAHQLQEDNTLHGAGTLHGKIVLVP